MTPSADAGEASGDSTFLAGSGLDQAKHGDSAQAPGRGAEGSHDGGGIGNRVLMDTNKASLRLARQHCSYLLCSFRAATLCSCLMRYDRSLFPRQSTRPSHGLGSNAVEYHGLTPGLLLPEHRDRHAQVLSVLVGRAVSATGELLPNLWDAAMSALNNPAHFAEEDQKLTLGRVRSAQAQLTNNTKL